MIRITDQYFWNFVFLVFFIVLVVMGAIILDTETRIAYGDITLFDITLIALATYRLIRLFVYDATMKWFREQFLDAEQTKGGKVTLHKPTSGPRRTIADLLSSPWSFGLFAAATVAFFYLLSPYAVFPVLLLAIAGVASFLQLTATMLGTRVE